MGFPTSPDIGVRAINSVRSTAMPMPPIAVFFLFVIPNIVIHSIRTVCKCYHVLRHL